jgi:signal transduction histidine kinase
VTLGAMRAEDAEPSPGVVVTVADTGIGMDARTRERAFDEFFSTKATGSGLGLAFVQRVVESHGGSVTLASTIGRGTVVSLRLPAS